MNKEWIWFKNNGITLTKSIDNVKQKVAQIDNEASSSMFDLSLIEHLLTLSYEERIDAHESARELIHDLTKAGQTYYARQSKTPAVMARSFACSFDIDHTTGVLVAKKATFIKKVIGDVAQKRHHSVNDTWSNR